MKPATGNNSQKELIMSQRFVSKILKNKNMWKLLLAIMCFSFIYYAGSAQTTDQIEQLKIIQVSRHDIAAVNSDTIIRSEYELILTLLHRFYKKYISSQDSGSCVYTPSCSGYFVESIRTEGFAKGLLNGIDRIIRCTNHAAEYFTEKDKNDLIIDPVRNIHYEKD